MHDTGKVAVAQWTSHGKEHIVLIRALDAGLVMHALYYADEVRSLAEITEAAAGVPARPAEVDLARKLIDQLSNDEFRPETYHDAHRERVQAVVEQKVAGQEVAETPEAATPRAQVIDLMDALKESLARGRGAKGRDAAAAGKTERAAKTSSARRPTAAARAAADETPPKRARKKQG
jgi:DNA end-binding protein Ku